MMLTGDNQATARTIAAEAGIAEVHAGLLPEDKLAVIADLQTRFGATGMAGDGINDAPALAKADIGFAMGGADMGASLLVVFNGLRPLKGPAQHGAVSVGGAPQGSSHRPA